MADYAENLRTFVLADVAIAAVVGTRMHQNSVPEDAALPFIWYRQAGVVYEGCTDSAAGDEPDQYDYDVECVSDDVDEAADLAALVRPRLAFHRGTLGAGSTQGILVEDHEDDYFKRNEDADAGIHVASFRVSVMR